MIASLSLFFLKCNLLRSHIHHVIRDDHIVEADAAGMKRVAPFVFVPMQETEHHDGDPAVNEDGICQKIQPGFKGSANLPEHRDREDVLPYADDLPNLDGKHFIQYVCVERNQIVNVRADDKEGGQQQEIRLHQIDHTVQHHDVVLGNPLP